jgi:hypothetical protein
MEPNVKKIAEHLRCETLDPLAVSRATSPIMTRKRRRGKNRLEESSGEMDE